MFSVLGRRGGGGGGEYTTARATAPRGERLEQLCLDQEQQQWSAASPTEWKRTTGEHYFNLLLLLQNRTKPNKINNNKRSKQFSVFKNG
jgi:hypothetical protein